MNPLLPEESGKPCVKAIDRGLCKADCCKRVVIPFLKINYYGMKDKMFSQPDETLELLDVIYAYREDMVCIYLNQESNMCQIYNDRPQICSSYGRGNYCLHYDKNNKYIPINKRKRLEFDTPESVRGEYFKLKEEMLKVKPKQIKRNQDYIELMSLATPERYIKALQLIRPDMVRDMQTIRRS